MSIMKIKEFLFWSNFGESSFFQVPHKLNDPIVFNRFPLDLNFASVITDEKYVNGAYGVFTYIDFLKHGRITGYITGGFIKKK